jgi:hypothetical protein
VPPPDLAGVGPGGQPLGHERSDGLQHPGPGPEPGAVEVDQAVPGQRLRQLQRPVLLQARHCRRGRDGPAVGEDGRDLQQRPLGVFQQAHAPLDRGAQGALPFGQVHRAGPERIQGCRQTVEQRGRVQQPDACRGQLDGQRQALQPTADLGHRRRVGLGHGKAGPHHAGPVDKQFHRRRGRHHLHDRAGTGAAWQL